VKTSNASEVWDAALAGGSRDAFRSWLALDDATWARGRGWAR
jgi:hypothetical protein